MVRVREIKESEEKPALVYELRSGASLPPNAYSLPGDKKKLGAGRTLFVQTRDGLSCEFFKRSIETDFPWLKNRNKTKDGKTRYPYNEVICYEYGHGEDKKRAYYSIEDGSFLSFFGVENVDALREETLRKITKAMKEGERKNEAA